jgi:spore coat polysaccharide biosynthesis predicted glycosyltransferase SpsG
MNVNIKKKILYKVEGSEEIGMGHVFRSFFLIQKLKRKYDVIIFTASESKSEDFFKKKNFEVITYKKRNQFKILKKFIINYKIKRFINDLIIFDKKIYYFLKEIKCKCFFLDTKNIRASNNFYCINTFIRTKQKHKNYYYGLKYVITDPSLKSRRNYTLNKGVKLLLHFGGTDDRMLNIKIINILSEIKNLKNVSIILGPALKYKHDKIYQSITKAKFNVKVYNYPKRLNSIYNSCNLAITTGGNTLFNFCSINLKNISISANSLEIKNCKKMKKSNLTNYFGHYLDFDKKKFIQFYNKVLLKKQVIKNKFLFNGVNEIYKIVTKS